MSPTICPMNNVVVMVLGIYSTFSWYWELNLIKVCLQKGRQS